MIVYCLEGARERYDKFTTYNPDSIKTFVPLPLGALESHLGLGNKQAK